MTQGEPAAAAGAWGSQISRQSAWQAAPSGNCPGWQRGRDRAVRARGKGCPQVIGALVIGRQIAAEPGRLGNVLDVGAAGRAAGSAAPGTGRRRHRTNRIAGHAQHLHGAEPAMHHRPARGAAPPARTTGRALRRPAPSAPGRARRPRRRRVVTRISAPKSRARRTAAAMSSSGRGAMPRSSTSAPSLRARAISAKPLE